MLDVYLYFVFYNLYIYSVWLIIYALLFCIFQRKTMLFIMRYNATMYKSASCKLHSVSCINLLFTLVFFCYSCSFHRKTHVSLCVYLLGIHRSMYRNDFEFCLLYITDQRDCLSGSAKVLLMVQQTKK